MQREYGYIGYFLYAALLSGVIAGLVIGVVMPFKGISSLSGHLPQIQKRLALICLIAYAAFAGISTYRMISTDFTLGLF